MASIRLPENIGALSKQSATTVQLAASRVNIGGQQYVTTSPIQCSTAVIGASGVDSTLQNWKLYYVYAVVSSGAVALVSSVSSTGPSGFSQYRLVGYFDTNGSAQILSAASTLIGAVGDFKSAHMTEAQFQAVNGPGWILADGRNVMGSTWSGIQGSLTVPDARGVALRGKNNGRADGNQNPDGEVALGTFQADAMQGHLHSLNSGTTQSFPFTPQGTGPFTFSFGNGATVNNANSSYLPISDGANGTPRTATESRMRNVTVNHFIKVN